MPMDLSGPRWKGKDFSAIAAANPMSSIMGQLQTSLSESKSVAILAGCDAVFEAGPEQANLLNRAAFGRQVVTSDKDKQWFEIGPEEAFYLCHSLKCLKILQNGNEMSDEDLWNHLSSMRESFPELYKAYWHLRLKNWVVRSGMQYGVDFVAYRHHPALVHSEYAVLVVSEGQVVDERRGRLKVWSDLLCTLRACGSVAKTLLVLSIRSCCNEMKFPECLEEHLVDEKTIKRWIPARSREEQESDADESIQEHIVDEKTIKRWIPSRSREEQESDADEGILEGETQS